MKQFFYQRKSYMTLLETLIAISLLSILLTIVFGFFKELAVLTQLTEKQQQESFQMRYVESRLAFVFERVVNENTSGKKFFFYTQPINKDFSSSPSLILTFDNSVRADPRFSGDILARLYVDLDHRLCLATWPLLIPEPQQYLQEEILLENVKDMQFELYSPPESISSTKTQSGGKKIDTEAKTPERDKWHNEWLMSYHQMPSLLKIKVTKNPKIRTDHSSAPNKDVQELTFSFVLPSSKNPIHYPH